MESESQNYTANSLQWPAPTRSPGIKLRRFEFPDHETQIKRKPPIPSPRTRRTVTSVQSQSASSEGSEDMKPNRAESTLLRRKSKKLLRNEVQTISMKISELKSDISSLEKKLVRLDSSDSSQSDDAITDTGMGEFPEVFEECENVVGPSPQVDGAFSGVTLRRESLHYDEGLRDRRTKHLLHSTIWQVPLYQEYHIDETAETEGSAAISEESEELWKENAEKNGAANVGNSLEGESRPESGIGLEGEGEGEGGGEGEESLDCYYTPMWNNGSRLVERRKSTDFSTTNSPRNADRCSPVQLMSNPERYSWNYKETECSSQSRDSAGLHYMIMNRTYANMCMGRACETGAESVYNSVHDIFGAVQVEKESAAQEEFYGGEVDHFVPFTRAKQMPGWCNIPAVRDSGLLENMTKKQRHLHEAKYELISSKVSYLKSLSVLQAIFIENANLKKLMSTTEWDNLFQYIGPIKQCSEHFLADLLSGWPQDIFMSNQLLVVRQYALTGLQTYVNYCSNKVTMDKTLANIRANNQKVNSALKKLERDEICDNNTLESFLVLPIQRITRFPLLVEGIILRMDSNTDNDFCAWAKTYRELVEMAKRCNEAVRATDDASAPASPEICRSKTLPGRNRMGSALSPKGTTLPKRHGSTIWHDDV